MITIYCGKPGSGKTTKIASVILDLLHRNERWYQKQVALYVKGQLSTEPELRQIATNVVISDWVKELYPNGIRQWSEVRELVDMKGVDLIVDEVANLFDANNWQNLPIGVKTFLRQHEKRGVDIYATTQNFETVDVSFRRLVTELYECKKLFGSGRPAPRKPDIKRVWGLVWLSEIEAESYEDKKKRASLWPHFCWISRKLVSVFNTLQEIDAGKMIPYQHMERECSDPNCSFHRIIHV